MGTILEAQSMKCSESQESYSYRSDDQPVGYRRLIVWKNAVELRKLIYQVTLGFDSIEMRRVSQMRDAARSVKQNIQEGYSKNTIGNYMRSLQISRGSLAELIGDLDDCIEDGLIHQSVYTQLNNLGHRTQYLLDRLLTSLSQMRNQDEWKVRWPKEKFFILFFLLLPFSSLFFRLG